MEGGEVGLREEIFQQPDVLDAQLQAGWADAQRVAGAIAGRPVEFIFLAARGTSDHAGLYAKYLLGAFNRLPIALAAPSLFSLYDRPPRLERALVLGISQSGQSPDIVRVVEEGRRQGAATLVITNDPESPLAAASEHLLDVRAGPERAVAATKTYTAELLTVALLSTALAGDDGRRQALDAVPGLVRRALDGDPDIARRAERYRYAEQCVVLARGFNYANAFEWSLKLKELAYIVAAPYSSADFRHGPVAVVAPGFPVFAIAPSGVVLGEVLDLLRRLRAEQGAELLVISDDREALELADVPLPLPGSVPEWLSPIVSIVPAQLFCDHLTRARGFDADEPRGLTKITRSW